ncbi:hypothetical protein B0H12DRAFT_1083214 [Mycena haematopus]|nr:hypothetical protein B0H12DRAFT_1083214 [Mycena haematopus]
MKGRPRIPLTAGCSGGNDHGKPGNGNAKLRGGECRRILEKGFHTEEWPQKYRAECDGKSVRPEMAVGIPQKIGRKDECKDDTIMREAADRDGSSGRARTGNRKCELQTRNMKSDLNQEFEAIYGRKNTAKIMAERRGEGASNDASRRPAELAEAAARDPEIGGARW